MGTVPMPELTLKPLNFGNNKSRDYREVFRRDSGRGYGAIPYGAYRRLPDYHVQQVVQHFAQPGDKILELGCNVGSNLLPLAQKGIQCFGIDISADALRSLKYDAEDLKVCEKVQVSRWDFAESGDVPLEWEQTQGAMEGQFKVIMAIHTLSHLNDETLIRTMQSMKKYLAPGGIMLVSIIDPVPNQEAGQQTRSFSKEDDLRSGFTEHSEETVLKAFDGLRCLKTFSRQLDMYREPVIWRLPKHQLRWYVFQK
jgi:SAM-dependent methyltransferase